MCGPERGLTPTELRILQQQGGFQAAHMGVPIYRVELAVGIATSVVAGRAGWMELGFEQMRQTMAFTPSVD